MATVMESQETLKAPPSKASDRNTSASEYSASESEAEEPLTHDEPHEAQEIDTNDTGSDTPQSSEPSVNEITAKLDDANIRLSSEHLDEPQQAVSGDNSFVLDDLSPEEAIAAGLA